MRRERSIPKELSQVFRSMSKEAIDKLPPMFQAYVKRSGLRRLSTEVSKGAKVVGKHAGVAAGFVRAPATREEKKEIGKAIHGKNYGESS